MVGLVSLGVRLIGRRLVWVRQGVNGISLGDSGSVIIHLFKIWLVLCKINTLNLINLNGIFSMYSLLHIFVYTGRNYFTLYYSYSRENPWRGNFPCLFGRMREYSVNCERYQP